MRLNNYLRDDLVLSGLDAADATGAIETFGSAFEATGRLLSKDQAIQALQAREKIHTTVLGDGVAVPHAMVPELADVLLLVAKASEPLQFGPPETDPVDLFFVLLSPPGREGEHIKLLARICRLMRHPGFLDDLRAAKDAAGILEVLLRVDSDHV
jgi:mannitol/fructose-specific phosphotransferase system IIA component (Ntr-type)